MMNKYASRSFWLAALIIIASVYFTYVKIMDGTQWITLTTVVLGLWQVKDVFMKPKAP